MRAREDTATDTVVSVRYPLMPLAAQLQRERRFVSVEVAALVALELCEGAEQHEALSPEGVHLNIQGEVEFDTTANVSIPGALRRLLIHWFVAAHPKARRTLQASVDAPNLQDEFASLLAPISRDAARASLIQTLASLDSTAPSTVLSGLGDAILEREAIVDDRPILLGPKREEEAPSRIGDYDVFGPIGGGGMAEVLLARSRSTGRPCVLKRMLPKTKERPMLRQMFTDEARLGLCLQHPHIVQVHRYCHGDGTDPFIVMEWAYGLTLSTTLRLCRAGERALPIGVVLRIGEAMSAALSYAYEATDGEGRSLRVVHRDVTPQNVVLQFDGHIKLLDFGVARSAVQEEMSQAGTVKGKFGYMSPEQSLGLPVDDRSDVFAVAICLYEALSCQPLFSRDRREGVVQALAEKPVPDIRTLRPDTPPTLAKLLQRMLSAEASGRPDIHQVGAALRTLANHRTDGAAFDVANAVQVLQPDWQDWRGRLALPPLAATRPTRRRGLTHVALALLAGLLMIGGVLWWRADRNPPRSNTPPEAQGRLPRSPQEGARPARQIAPLTLPPSGPSNSSSLEPPSPDPPSREAESPMEPLLSPRGD